MDFPSVLRSWYDLLWLFRPRMSGLTFPDCVLKEGLNERYMTARPGTSYFIQSISETLKRPPNRHAGQSRGKPSFHIVKQNNVTLSKRHGLSFMWLRGKVRKETTALQPSSSSLPLWRRNSFSGWPLWWGDFTVVMKEIELSSCTLAWIVQRARCSRCL